MNQVSIKFYLNQSKKSSQSLKTPVYCRLIQGRTKKEFRLPKIFDLDESDSYHWNEISQRLNKKNCPLNDYLNHLEYKIKGLLTFNNENNELTLDKILEKIQNNSDKKINAEPTIIDFLEKYQITKVEIDTKTEGTKKNYRNAIKQLKMFLRVQQKEKIKMSEFTHQDAVNFKNYLESSNYTDPNSGRLIFKESNTAVSSSTKIKNLKPIFDEAISQELIRKNPFDKIKLLKISPKKPCLSLAQVVDIYDLKLSRNDYDEFTKDIFLFMCFTGLSITDALTLATDEIKPTLGGRLFLDTTRNKTKMQVRQVICIPAENILKKYCNSFEKGFKQKVFPNITSETVNIKLKNLAKDAKINFNLSTSIARITCRELLGSARLDNSILKDIYLGWSPKAIVEMQYYEATELKLLSYTNEFDMFLHKLLVQKTEFQDELSEIVNSLVW